MGVDASDSETPPVAWARRTFAALSHRNYRLFFIGMAISSVGGWARSAGQQQLVWELTRDERWLGWVGAAALLSIDPVCTATPPLPTFRGGAWNVAGGDLRAVDRGKLDAVGTDLGFRCARR